MNRPSVHRVLRKSIDIKETDWEKLKQLALNQNMTVTEEIDQIIGTFLSCVEDNDIRSKL
jgi:macrodomain Ter protein organizer (MatP/YcbG family)